ncbi:GAF domain-containing protein [Alkalinema sp. FACHB-956]|uniref:sensor histidine kinase n=1 Tax=Alkalinema sp. FACHB-956 TaxID=2692768 RepID=UPI001684BAFC|nr:GAF domain-containing protein [Alkalinema sp. FACHB-956]MBD2325857.1 GAF domain-containing protein [Alkalinema sp. FACHB-956]
MDAAFWDKIRTYCRDEAAFENCQQMLLQELHPLEEAARNADFQLERHKALLHVITRLREPIDLEEIFQATAIEIRQLLAVDRVGMFRFHPDSGWDDGEFVSEDVDPEFSSAIAEPVHDHCFGDQFAVHYQAGRIQAVADIYDAGLSDCHIQVLAQFQVRANLVVPLLLGQNLWGLLCIHHCRGPRQWDPTEIEFVTQIAGHLGVALYHAELMVELRREILDRQQAEQRAHNLNQELRQAIVELKAVNKELEAFSYSVSHDLRAPLRSIDGFSQALLEDCLEHLDSNGRDYLQRIRAASQRMGQLIDDLLMLSRVTRSDLRRDAVDLSYLANQLCWDLQQIDPSRSINCVIQSNVVTQGDPLLLRVMMENLLSNAWKFTSKQPQALIEFGAMRLAEVNRPELNWAIDSTSPEQLVYFVRDNGVGFDMVYVDKLFQPFQRLHRINEFPGNGVGLATVQRVVRRHGGRVWAEGHLNQGATFYFTLMEGIEES